MADLKTATSAVPSVIVGQQLPTSEAAQYTAIAGTTVKVSSALLLNTSAAPVNVWLSVVKSGGAGGTSNRVLNNYSLAVGTPLDLGASLGWLGEGDFISGYASAATSVTLDMSGIVFSSTITGAPTGIQDDAVGSGGRGTASVTGTNAIGTGANRYLIAALLTQPNAGFPGYASYTTLSMSCTDGAMTRLVSADLNYGSGPTGAVHLFGRANPTSSSSQTLTANVAATSFTFVTLMGSMSLSGVNSATSPTGAVTSAPTASTALSLAVASAAGHRPFFAAGLTQTPLDFNLRTRYINGATAGFTTPQWLLMADALGSSTVTATTSNASYYSAVGVDLIPA